MKTSPLLTITLFLSLATIACAEQESEIGTSKGEIKQDKIAALEIATACDAENPCTGNLACYFIDVDNFSDAVCIDDEAACDFINCGEGDCLILESYPMQLGCSFDTPTRNNPDDDDTTTSEPGQSELGNPGE